MSHLDASDLGARIREARVRADLSQEELASRVGFSGHSVIAKIETGTRKVSALELSDIAAAIGVQMIEFFEEPVPAIVSHRESRTPGATDSTVDARLALLAREVEFVESLAGGESLGFDRAPDEATLPGNVKEAESLAAEARKTLGLDARQPVHHLAETVGKVGLVAFSADVGRDLADAGTVLLRRGAVSFVNSHADVGRRRLALAHELGHYLCADDYVIDWRVDSYETKTAPVEALLDRFARAFLLPEDALQEVWAPRVEEHGPRRAAAWVAHQYRIDMATLARRLREVGLADHETAGIVRSHRTTRSDIMELNLYVPAEEMAGTTVPRSYEKAVLRLVEHERISRERALDLLQGTLSDDDLPAPRNRRSDEIWTFVS